MAYLGYIYAVRDPRFDVGVKVGRDSSLTTRLHRAQCYAENGIESVAVWLVPDGGRFASLAEAEAKAREDAVRILGPNVGAEWLFLTPAEVVEHVSDKLGLRPHKLGLRPRFRATYDDYRDPKDPLKMSGRYRQLMWVFVEHETGALKIQRNHWWHPNLTGARTYSRCGFTAAAGFTRSATPPCDLFGFSRENMVVHGDWEQIVRDHGGDPDHDQAVGWLRRRTTVGDLRDRLTSLGYRELDLAGPKPDWVKRSVTA